MTLKNNQTKHAIFLEGWSYKKGNKSELLTNGKIIAPNDYSTTMNGNIYCPSCYTNLSRSPKEKKYFSNGRKACFIHLPSYSHIDCDRRTPKPEGMLYLTEELAKQAIENNQLAIINSFLLKAPTSEGGKSQPYDQSAVEEIFGPTSNIPISRHNGEHFKLPSKISTVSGICREFDKNIYKYYVLPNKNKAIKLIDLLTNIKDVDETNNNPKLYFGKIISSHNSGQYPKPTNTRMTELLCHKHVKDFYLKAVDSEQSEKGIGNKSINRILIFWGKITESGIGLCVKNLNWGEYALLPEKYNFLLE